ncbi:SusC/RagA family TonB-linked outer membrane protein [Pedobacter mucosus]|uniref:SusC/RagA family TonB-linked outer membrane protein n=1 Tax=Pedobacter mucosus TaxID=2895286 RepID=UPI001EE3B34E|nr:SusC/RagA family TonB-linked outer membrane protein [Pedobacter mucosus]UKT65016.1 SusC/RagA family TonB-linked outer membrane protein [Pedobacter mucosus]
MTKKSVPAATGTLCMQQNCTGSNFSGFNYFTENQLSNLNQFKCMDFYTLKRPVLFMKLTAILLLSFILQGSASTFAQRISITARNVPVSDIFKMITKQSGYDFIYNDYDLKPGKKISIRLQQANINSAMDLCLKDQNLTYLIRDKTIIIKKKEKSLFETLSGFFSLDVTLSGTVLSEEGSGLPNVNIRIKGGRVITVSNAAGDFSIAVPEGTVLEFASIGYKTQELVIRKNASKFIVRLAQDVSKLDEVAVQAYGKGSQRLATSNISKISGEELNKQPVNNIFQAVEGRIPGMVVSQNTGVPGARLSIQIRGRANFDSSLSSDQPLFIIDGVPVAAGNDKVNVNVGPFGAATSDGLSAFAGLNAADIESIDVLKDADATAIYGSRGANGVILITTKKGRPGKLKISATVYSGVSNVSSLPKMMNTQQYLEMRNEAFANDNIVKTNANAYDVLLWDNNRYTDFAELLVGNSAKTNDAQVTFSGGDKNTQYRLGGGYHKDGTVWPGEKSSDRASVSFNLHSATENQKFSIDFSGLYSITNSDLVGGDLAGAVTLPPNFRLYDAKGNLAWNEGGYDGKDNPLSQLNLIYRSNMNSINANTVLNYKITRDLTIRSSFGYNSTITDDKRLMPLSSQNPNKPNLGGLSLLGNSVFRNWIAEPQAEYTKKISKGTLNVLLGATYNSRNTSSLQGRGTGYTSDDLLESLGAAQTVTITNTASTYKYQAFFGRINYNWDQKYIINLTGRRDGSSRFGPESRFSSFGAGGAAWIFSSEDYFKNSRVLSYGKLRASYGVTGNDQIGEYAYLDSYTNGPTYGDSTTLAPGKLYNPKLHWERNIKAELGLELGFLKDRILFTASVYQNVSSDPLVTYPLPRITGFTGVVNNLEGVRVQNRGLELTLTTKNINSDKFTWASDFNITVPKNILKAYPDLASSSYATKYAIGQSLNRIFATEFLGVDPATGLYTVNDVNGDKIANVLDYIVQGNTDPKFYGGLNNNFSYGRFSASFFLQFTRQLGKDWRASQAFNLPGGMLNFPTLALDRWQAPGQQADVQKYTTLPGSLTGLSGTYAYISSGGSYTDASYVRLKNVYLAYDLPINWLSTIHINSCRLYFQAQNVFVITGYKGADPETQSYTRMAPLRTFTAGLQISL